jgi:hypothetical protein
MGAKIVQKIYPVRAHDWYGCCGEGEIPMDESKMHFQQIPVEIVKKIATDLPEDSATGHDSVSAGARRPASVKAERWRDVAQQVQQEQDPNKMIKLVDQLITKFDEENSRTSRNPRNGGPNEPHA